MATSTQRSREHRARRKSGERPYVIVAKKSALTAALDLPPDADDRVVRDKFQTVLNYDLQQEKQT